MQGEHVLERLAQASALMESIAVIFGALQQLAATLARLDESARDLSVSGLPWIRKFLMWHCQQIIEDSVEHDSFVVPKF